MSGTDRAADLWPEPRWPEPGSEETPWEPPLAGTEVEHLLGALDRQRATFRWKADGLDAAGLAVTVGASSLTLGSLLKHLAVVEDFISTSKLNGADMPEVWHVPGWDEEGMAWQFTSAARDTPEQLHALWEGATARCRAAFAAAIAERGLDGEAHVAMPDGRHASIRRLLLDLLEEYGRHTGHADLIREAVDGRTGEDPPPGWRPVGAA